MIIASTGSGELGVHRPGRRQRLRHALLEILERVARLRARGAAEQDVAQDQPEGVDVGALIDRLTAACSGAM